jgi:crotonobetainyl-CoA:carnitine CoA-transferase CaiB-like acyl-CoA transferase
MEQAGTPFHIETPPATRRPAPLLGEHTAEVLAELSAAVESEPRATPADGSQQRAAVPPLDGLRVVDLGSYLAGPYGPMLLADLGADVVKVEAPSGDAMRWNEAAFEACQRGKRSVCIDLGDPASRPILEALVDSADVVHHNIRAGSARRLGVDGPRLRALNDRLVFCHVSAYGPSGPRASWPGYDQLFQAATGWEVEAAGEGNPPMWHRFGMMDHLAAMASAVATLLALVQRQHSGQGQEVSSSLLGAAVLSMGHTYRRADGSLPESAHLDRAQTGTGPASRIYETADGWVAVVDRRRGAVDRLLAALGASVSGELERCFATTTTASVLAALGAVGVPCEPVRCAQREAFLDSASNHRCRLVVSYPHPAYGRIEQIGAFWDFGDLPLYLDRAAPTCGQHSEEILRELGVQVSG